MKKTIAFLIVLMLCMPCLSLTTFAAENNGMTPVLVKVPEDWGAPDIWAWADDGDNAFAAWPGEALEEWTEGWYYIYVPDFVQNVIISANQDTDSAVQTDGIVVEAGKEVWITVAEDNSAAVSYEAQLRGEIPEYVERFVVHAYVPLSWQTANLWAWSAPDGTNAFSAWPGETMTEGDDGWFTARAPVWINSLIISGNEGSVQTEDISVEGKELWVTVYEDLTYELSYEDPEKQAENITIYAQVPADWDSPCCWAWSAPDGTNAFSSWPGEALVQEGDWYAIEVPGWINSVIINANEGNIQTTDLSVEAGRDVWITVADAENASVSYEEPSGEVVSAETETAAGDESETRPSQESGNRSGALIGAVAVAVVLSGTALVLKKKKK